MVLVTFNQDCTSLAVGSSGGYQLYTIANVNHISRIHSNEVDKDTYIVERLFSSSLIVVVNKGSPCTVKVCHFKKGSEICTYSYPNEILSLKINRQRLVVCLEDHYYIHNIRDMKIIDTLKDTALNKQGLFALSMSNDSGYLAYPGSTTSGFLNIFDTITMEHYSSIQAHNNPLAAISFSNRSDMVATASTKGTVIRIFSVLDSTKLFEFRRGVKRCATIYSLAFSHDGLFLAASSNTETVHVFKLVQEEKSDTADDDSSWAGYVTAAFRTSAASLIPTTVSDAFSAWRAFATARLSGSNKLTTCGIASINKSPHIFVVDTEGLLQVFQLDTEYGGDCVLVNSSIIDIMESGPDANMSSEEGSEVKHDDKNICDASYAYKLKREKRLGPSTPSQELDEIIDNVPAIDLKTRRVSPTQLRLDDENEFPPMN